MCGRFSQFYTWQELQALLQQIYSKTPPHVIGRLRKIMNPG